MSMLDAAVAAAYGWPVRQAQGWPVDLPDEAILERLLELNLSRAAAHEAADRERGRSGR